MFGCLLFSSCYSVHSQPIKTNKYSQTSRRISTINLGVPFNSEEVSWFKEEGNNTIEGEALIRTLDGSIKTCAGYKVTLTPLSSYATQVMKFYYGSDSEGFLPTKKALEEKVVQLEPYSEEYYKLIREAVCDINGKFKFENLPDGTYYLEIPVTWWERDSSLGVPVPKGGTFIKKITLKGGEVKKIMLSH